jgi:hypothetical protein
MAFPTLLVAAVLLGAYALYKYWDTSRRHRIPTGLKPLPGPKGMHSHPVDSTLLYSRWTLCNVLGNELK